MNLNFNSFNAQACEMKRVLLDRIEKLGAILPANTLDQGRCHSAMLS